MKTETFTIASCTRCHGQVRIMNGERIDACLCPSARSRRMPSKRRSQAETCKWSPSLKTRSPASLNAASSSRQVRRGT